LNSPRASISTLQELRPADLPRHPREFLNKLDIVRILVLGESAPDELLEFVGEEVGVLGRRLGDNECLRYFSADVVRDTD
jgi:hypothetical protein